MTVLFGPEKAGSLQKDWEGGGGGEGAGVGAKVSFFRPDDEVVGVLPLDSEDPGLCEVIQVHEHYLARVIDVSNGKGHVAESCLEETGGLGVDIVIDAGVRLYSKDDEPAVKFQLPHKHDIITLLGVGGHWVTTEENLQLLPLVYSARLCLTFLMSFFLLRPLLDEPIPLYEAKASMEVVQKNQERKKQVVQF
ncbi:Quinone oxidoreductase-like protein 1 [Microtus ochrogaster]|uniref:Quinone oxidoreductase-like protein 1 n=1 Tax=Microtus ochrogaster TaxID=79684 RepID=A0A8J6GDZ6_MICOH|nr:Quinone oxidoreductase-like protein 1 [Microtus ochrogaster]